MFEGELLDRPEKTDINCILSGAKLKKGHRK